jgi:hypothetical protein
MKISFKIIFIVLIVITNYAFSQFNYQRQWATYSGGKGTRGNFTAIDSQKNLICLNAVFPSTEPTSYYNQYATAGAYQPAIAGGDSDLYLTKFSPEGVLIWATYFGGSSFDNLYSFTLDADDNIYFGGQTGSSAGIATAGTYIQDFYPNTFAKNYLVKFNSNGTRQWGTYLPGGCRAMALGANNTIYVSGSITSGFVGLTNIGVFQENYQNLAGFDPNDFRNLNGYIVQLDTTTGNKVNATYCGPYFEISSMATDSAGNIIVGGSTNVFCLGTALSTPNAYQELQVNCVNYGSSLGTSDAVISKFTPNLQTRLWSTYYGGIGSEGINSLITYGEDIYISSGNSNNSILPTAGTFQQTPSGTLVSKFNSAGNRIWATGFGDNDTFVGNSSVLDNKLFFSGSVLATTTFPITTAGSYQETISGLTYINESGNLQTCRKGFFGQFNAKTGTRDWCSYYSGELYDFGPRITIQDENTFYLTGSTSSATGIATAGSHQPNISSDTNTFPPDPISYRTNSYIAKFSIPALATNSFSKTSLQLSPNPNDGIFSLQGDFNGYNNLQLVLCDNLGRNIVKSEVTVLQNQVNQVFNFSNELTSGVYIAKLVNDNEVLQFFKVLVQ